MENDYEIQLLRKNVEELKSSLTNVKNERLELDLKNTQLKIELEHEKTEKKQLEIDIRRLETEIHDFHEQNRQRSLDSARYKWRRRRLRRTKSVN
jgi:chromosome segregation ATPase